MPDEMLLTIPEVARLTGRDYRTVVRWCERGDVPSVKLGGQTYVNRLTLAKLIGYDPSVEHSEQPA